MILCMQCNSVLVNIKYVEYFIEFLVFCRILWYNVFQIMEYLRTVYLIRNAIFYFTFLNYIVLYH